MELACAQTADTPAVTQETVRAAETRRTGLDSARFLAALGIVWTHANGDAEYASPAALGRFAVPFFSVVAGIFLVDTLRKATELQARAFLAHRAAKLYIPFAAWTLIFIAIRVGAERFVAVNDPFKWSWWLPLTGSMYHLWFLPFLLIATLVLTPLIRLGLRNRVSSLILAAVMITGGLLLVNFPIHTTPIHKSDQYYFLDRVSTRAPALLWGVAIGLLFASNPRMWRVPRALAAVGFALTTFCMVVYWNRGRTPWAANLGGVAWLLMGLGIDQTAISRRLAPLGRLSYGIYLIHPLIVAICYKIWSGRGLKGGPLEVAAVFVTAAIVSVGVTKLIRSIKWAAWLAP